MLRCRYKVYAAACTEWSVIFGKRDEYDTQNVSTTQRGEKRLVWVTAQSVAQSTAADGDQPTFGQQLDLIKASGNWLHLAVILDRYSRQVVSWSIGECWDTELVSAALRMAFDL